MSSVAMPAASSASLMTSSLSFPPMPLLMMSRRISGFSVPSTASMVLVIGGTGYLYGGLIGAVAFKLLQDLLATWTPQYWQFWIGLILIVLVLVGRERLQRWIMWAPDRIDRRSTRARPRSRRGGESPMTRRAGNAGPGQDASAALPRRATCR